MAIIKPFPSIAPAPGMAHFVSCHSPERYTHKKLNEIVASNPYSYLQVLYAAKDKDMPYPEQLKIIRHKFSDFLKENILVEDTAPGIYIYRQIKNRKSHTCLIGLASLDDYSHGNIKIHEQTLREREQKLKDYLTVNDFNAEPVCLAYPYLSDIDIFIQNKTQNLPDSNFIIDMIQHSLWKIDSTDAINELHLYFSKIPYLYIADGHHRVASSKLFAEEKKKVNTMHNGAEPYNYFLAAFIADRELTIFNYNRLVNTLNGYSPELFLNALAATFYITPYFNKPILPRSANEISIYMKGEWHLLVFKDTVLPDGDVVDKLDVSRLSTHILKPLLAITDLRHDKRITFLPGTKDTGEIEQAVDSGKMVAAFCLYPVTFEELKSVADSGKVMPPKSTWIEPKFENGLLIYSLANP